MIRRSLFKYNKIEFLYSKISRNPSSTTEAASATDGLAPTIGSAFALATGAFASALPTNAAEAKGQSTSSATSASEQSGTLHHQGGSAAVEKEIPAPTSSSTPIADAVMAHATQSLGTSTASATLHKQFSGAMGENNHTEYLTMKGAEILKQSQKTASSIGSTVSKAATPLANQAWEAAAQGATSSSTAALHYVDAASKHSPTAQTVIKNTKRAYKIAYWSGRLAILAARWKYLTAAAIVASFLYFNPVTYIFIKFTYLCLKTFFWVVYTAVSAWLKHPSLDVASSIPSVESIRAQLPQFPEWRQACQDLSERANETYQNPPQVRMPTRSECETAATSLKEKASEFSFPKPHYFTYKDGKAEKVEI